MRRNNSTHEANRLFFCSKEAGVPDKGSWPDTYNADLLEFAPGYGGRLIVVVAVIGAELAVDGVLLAM